MTRFMSLVIYISAVVLLLNLVEYLIVVLLPSLSTLKVFLKYSSNPAKVKQKLQVKMKQQ